ncbi:MAG: polymer-forming cytoskeletal protein, partial [Alteromonadaceae bacterium]|nr:polymer-forming cytoskeletal protein [Alteromonadaceae bacterium]
MSNFTRVAVLIIVLFTPYSISAANYTLPNNPLPGCSLNNETDTYTCPNGLTLGFEDRLQVTGNRNVTINVTGDMNLGTRVRLNPNGQPDQLTIDTTGSFRGGYNNEINANISSGGSLRIDNETPVQGSLIAQTDLTLGFRSSLDGSATSLAGNVNTENEVQVSGDLSAAGNIVLAFRSEVAGNLSSGGNVSLQNEVELTGNVDAGGFVSLNFRSQVTGNIASGEDVTLPREVTVAGNVTLPGTVYAPDSTCLTGYVNAPDIYY